MSYHIGGATSGSFVTDLYGDDGKKIASIGGYNSIAISGDTVVKTLQFPPAANNLYISYDCGGTFTPLGDKDWYYGTVKEDASGVTYMSAELEIRDGYVYTHAVYDVFHDKTSDPLVTHAVRISIKTGAPGNSGLKQSNFKKAARRPPFSPLFCVKMMGILQKGTGTSQRYVV